MRVAILILATLALTLLALCEVGLACPVAWWLYLPVAITFAATLVRRAPARSQFVRFAVLGAVTAAIAALYFVDWTSRKPFLRDLARIQVGMSEAEVRSIMSGYLEGTGWPDSPFDAPQNGGTLSVVGSGSQPSTTSSPPGQVMLRDSLVFRHSNDGAFNSDWGIVSLSGGRVVRVEFSPD